MLESSPTRIKIYLIDDHPIVREGFARAIADEPDMVVIGQAGTAAEALKDAMTLGQQWATEAAPRVQEAVKKRLETEAAAAPK